ncbi:tetratricopeptide repeat protein [Massilia aerilata]|uniref:Sel1 repeat family protein n=1 Tax=Massilia aerilata TaxID=453817 RepID=A0ABW0RWT8_9BURK
MANREELAIIRGARAGRTESQLALGRLYLFGSAGLPKSLPTALHWLDRAARQGCAEAWQLIGNHIPLDLARQSPQPVTCWYERAYDGGLARAGLVYAQLVLGGERVPAGQRAKALRALEDAARGGFPEAQWLLAREHGATPPRFGGPAGEAAAGQGDGRMPDARTPDARMPRPEPRRPDEPGASRNGAPDRAGQRWLRSAADSGVTPAQFALLEQEWNAGQHQAYLERALPLARALARSEVAQDGACARLAPDEVTLLSRCARLVDEGMAVHDVAPDELHAFWELAAAEQDRHAQFALGLCCARMRVDGRRIPGDNAGNGGAANFKKAVRWLQQAGEQGLAEAWYALSRIYVKPEFSQRNVVEAQKYLERAAEMGYRDARLECGNAAWRARRENEGNDVRAVFWLQKAAAQGCAKAAAMLRKIAPREAGAWRELGALPGRDMSEYPLLAARIELALAFGLSRAEALLLDVRHADRGHCLVVDIRASYGRSRRRLVPVETAQERQLLDRVVRLFENVDCGPGGPEGNYRQRLYRLRTLLPESGGPDAPLDLDLAA